MFVLDIDRGAAIYLKVLALVGGAWNIYKENRDNIPKFKLMIKLHIIKPTNKSVFLFLVVN